jgi:hypothetical protein
MIYVQEKFEDTKGIINIRKTKKDRQYNDPKVQKYKTLHRKTKGRAIRTTLKSGGKLGCSEEYTVHAPHVTPVVLLLLQTH